MDINAFNSVSKVAMPAQKTEANKSETKNIEPKKDGNKKLALALTALAATAAAGVGIAVAAKKGKISLPTLKKSAQNVANETIKALPSGADDAIKALPGAADDAAKAVKDVADDVLPSAANDIAGSAKNVADDATKVIRAKLDNVNSKIKQYKELLNKDGISETTKKQIENRLDYLNKIQDDIRSMTEKNTLNALTPTKYLQQEKESKLEMVTGLIGAHARAINHGEPINEKKLAGLVKELGKITNQSFPDNSAAIEFVKKHLIEEKEYILFDIFFR